MGKAVSGGVLCCELDLLIEQLRAHAVKRPVHGVRPEALLTSGQPNLRLNGAPTPLEAGALVGRVDLVKMEELASASASCT